MRAVWFSGPSPVTPPRAPSIRNSRQCSEVRLHTALEIEVVVNFVDGVLVGETVEEFERPYSGLYGVRRRDGRRNVGGHFQTRRCARTDRGLCLAPGRRGTQHFA